VDMGMVLTALKHDLLEKIDYSQFDKKLHEQVVKGTFTPYAAGTMFFSTVMAYRTDVFPDEHPRTWAEFWDVKRFPGPRCLMSGVGTGPDLEFAVLAAGVPIDKIYPIDLDLAFKMFTKIRPYVVKWWDSGAIPPQLLVDKEVVLTSSYHGRIIKIMDEGAPVAIEWNQGELTGEYWSILKGTKNYKSALKFIEFATQARNQANFVKYYAAGPVNQKAFDFISPERARTLCTAPENVKGQFVRNGKWWGENRERVTEAWHEWAVQD
ncbi:MAG: extracellular solute-binding protein, partial [Deltaproteobacteria bacterium]|nr:extracellular solute-binding protein [Deltaproteobacteria bacterium]